MDPKIVEAAAIALLDACNRRPGGWQTTPDNIKELYRHDVRAALDAALSAGLCGERETAVAIMVLELRTEIARLSSPDRAAAIRREALEEAAKVAEDYGVHDPYAQRDMRHAASYIAARVRALIATPDKGGAHG